MSRGDLNGDGVPDLVVSNAGGPSGTTVTVLLGVGDGTFKPATSYPAGLEPFDIAVADFNGDGKLDLAVADLEAADGTGSTVSLLMGNGDGTFGAPASYPAGPGPVSVVARRFNDDRCPDLAVADFFGNSASILLNADGSNKGCMRKCGGEARSVDAEENDPSL